MVDDESRSTLTEQSGPQGVHASSAGAPAASAPFARKRSVHLTLVLISAAGLGGLAGCGNLENNERVNRDVYANMEACKADWGNPGDCEEIPAQRSATGTSSYYGPRYFSRTGSTTGYSSTTRPGSRSSGTVSSTPSRGGFGASASRHGGSSSSSSSSHSSGG